VGALAVAPWADTWLAIASRIGHERSAQARKAGSPTTPGRKVVFSLGPRPARLDDVDSITLTSSTIRCWLV